MFGHVSWELRSCGRQGHATYRPDEADLAERLRVATPWGDAWRCLRCGDYALGAPAGSGPAADAPVLLRGAALRDAFVLRLLAADKALRALLLGLVAFGIVVFGGHKDAVQRTLDAYLPLLSPLAERLGVRLQDAAAMHLIEGALGLPVGTIDLVAAGVGAYAALNLVEAVGLALMRRWGEYVSAVATSAFLPLEVHELLLQVTPLRVAALAINLFLVAYLVSTKRLFGVRGGKTAYEAERHGVSLLEVEVAAAGQRLRRGERPTASAGRPAPDA